MEPISVVIIARNEAEQIADCIISARLLTDDIIVVDTGSTDKTKEISEKCGASVIEAEWKSFGISRNTGSASARNNWILNLDADERITPSLINSLNALNLADPYTIFCFKRRNYFSNKIIQFGSYGFDKVRRLYHKKYAVWDSSPVHEKLYGRSLKIKHIKGCIAHYSIKNTSCLRNKTYQYAYLSALKYFQQDKKANFIKRYISPCFNAFRSYFILLGFLDGKKGFLLALHIGLYTHLKYLYLNKFLKDKRNQVFRFRTSFTNEQLFEV